jgi:hypothetical protein
MALLNSSIFYSSGRVYTIFIDIGGGYKFVDDRQIAAVPDLGDEPACRGLIGFG